MSNNDAEAFAIGIAKDAFRMAVGDQPLQHDVKTVIRWLKGMEHIHNPIQAYELFIGARNMGSLGAAARNRNLTPERRSEIARAAALRRWSNRPKQRA